MLATERRAPKKRADDPWLSTNQAAEYIGFAARTLAHWRGPYGNGRGPKYSRTPSGHPRYRRSELDRWLKKQGRA